MRYSELISKVDRKMVTFDRQQGKDEEVLKEQ